MIIVGLTGGIGSGKTTVCKIFECLGIPVFYADAEAKKLMSTDIELVENIKSAFGQKAYQSNSLNRSFLADQVFGDPKKLKVLNDLVHPAVGRATIKWREANSSSPYGLKEAAILFESGSYRQVSKVISVWAPLELRIKRVMLRDNVMPEAVLARIKNQLSESLRLSLSDFVIENDGRQLLIPQVLRLHETILTTTNA